jgi:hypothetical protein
VFVKIILSHPFTFKTLALIRQTGKERGVLSDQEMLDDPDPFWNYETDIENLFSEQQKELPLSYSAFEKTFLSIFMDPILG